MLRRSLLLVLVSACTVEPLALEDRECPCVAGWVCDEALGRCVPANDVGSDAGATDSGVDGPRADARPDGAPDSGATDSATADTTMMDAAMDTATVDTGPAPTACADVYADRLFCDGFEDTGFAAWDGMRTPGASTVERVTDVVYRGDGALMATATADQRFAGLHASVFAVPAPSDQYMRAYYYIPSGYPDGMEFSEMASATRDENFIVFTRSAAEHDFHTHGWSGGRQSLSMLLPKDTWFCLEAHIEMGNPGSISVFVDGTMVATETGLDNSPPDGLELVVAGIAWNNDGAERVLYVDEVVADTAPIGCD